MKLRISLRASLAAVTVTVAGTNDAPSLLVRSHAVAEDGARVTGNDSAEGRARNRRVEISVE